MQEALIDSGLYSVRHKKCSPNVAVMLRYSLRRWPNITNTMGQPLRVCVNG